MGDPIQVVLQMLDKEAAKVNSETLIEIRMARVQLMQTASDSRTNYLVSQGKKLQVKDSRRRRSRWIAKPHRQ